jgi:hypothetical protein
MAGTLTVENPASGTPGTSPGDLNKKLLADIKLGEDVAEIAEQEPYATALVAEEISAEKVAALKSDCAAARTFAGQTVAARRSKEVTTESEGASLTALLESLRDIQKRAKRKFGRDTVKLKAYRVGKKNFGNNRTELEQDAPVIIDLAVADGLPGLTAEKIAAARQQLAAWKGTDEVQTSAEQARGEQLRQLQAKVADINQARREIQFAADALWPHTKADNAPLRKSFKLPAKRPMQ